MIAVTHFRADAADFADRAPRRARRAGRAPGLPARQRRPPHRRPGAWVLLTEWENVGSYRRALGDYEVKLHATPLLGAALDLPGAFETLLDVAPGGDDDRARERPRARMTRRVGPAECRRRRRAGVA